MSPGAILLLQLPLEKSEIRQDCEPRAQALCAEPDIHTEPVVPFRIRRFRIRRISHPSIGERKRAAWTSSRNTPKPVVSLPGARSDHSTMLIEGFTLRSLEAENRRHALSFHSRYGKWMPREDSNLN
ncbi:hypothetical protein [Qipengyuania sp. SM2507]